jgi:adenine-specific DNA-methyltransferase
MSKELGQYFTTNAELKVQVSNFILNNPDCILEPSVGQGDLVAHVQKINPSIKFDMYEIDRRIPLLKGIAKKDVLYGDFMQQPITKTYKTIIGNPPYVRTSSGNLYIDFVKKCYELLEPNGELIFIVPSDFLKLTSAASILNAMMSTGTFTHIYHPHNEKLFENASIDVIVFRYCKGTFGAEPTGKGAECTDKSAFGAEGLTTNQVLYNSKLLYIINTNGLITFSETPPSSTGILLENYFDVYVGLVTGKEEVYKHAKLGNIEVLNGEDKCDKYIYVEQFPSNNPQINAHLLKHKPELLERKIRKFNEKNWFEWGAPRNISAMRENIGKECIYVYNLTRKTEVAFKGTVQYFGGGLLMLIPKKNFLDKGLLDKVVQHLNSNEFKSNYMFSGRFKIGHRQLCNIIIPECSP